MTTPTTTFKIEADSRGVRWLHLVERRSAGEILVSANRIKVDAITAIHGAINDRGQPYVQVSAGAASDRYILPAESDAVDLATDLWLAITGMSGPTFERVIPWGRADYDAGQAVSMPIGGFERVKVDPREFEGDD